MLTLHTKRLDKDEAQWDKPPFLRSSACNSYAEHLQVLLINFCSFNIFLYFVSLTWFLKFIK